jgi:hypothetical protein
MSRSKKVLAAELAAAELAAAELAAADPIAVDAAVRNAVTLVGEVEGQAKAKATSQLMALRSLPRPDYFDLATTRSEGSQSKAWVESLACSYYVGYSIGMVASGMDAESAEVRGVRLGTASSKKLGLSGKSDSVTSAVNDAKAAWAMAAKRAGLMCDKPKTGAAGATDSTSAEPATVGETLPADITTKVDKVTLEGFKWIASSGENQATFRKWLATQPDYAKYCGI